ncbi:uncharacterized protein LOC108607769 isoform X2 [Drosophila busckii]|uniref:uncharacterized protein LOC108607769 isoform X2 n=1 Tax=Drosophila busckii TaxID=30019 RepID=UPI00083EE374|nr:uncharacterized protein LOC108607769 isoform X2 [Drosophila busckii]
MVSMYSVERRELESGTDSKSLISCCKNCKSWPRITNSNQQQQQQQQQDDAGYNSEIDSTYKSKISSEYGREEYDSRYISNSRTTDLGSAAPSAENNSWRGREREPEMESRNIAEAVAESPQATAKRNSETRQPQATILLIVVKAQAMQPPNGFAAANQAPVDYNGGYPIAHNPNINFGNGAPIVMSSNGAPNYNNNIMSFDNQPPNGQTPYNGNGQPPYGQTPYNGPVQEQRRISFNTQQRNGFGQGKENASGNPYQSYANSQTECCEGCRDCEGCETQPRNAPSSSAYMNSIAPYDPQMQQPQPYSSSQADNLYMPYGAGSASNGPIENRDLAEAQECDMGCLECLLESLTPNEDCICYFQSLSKKKQTGKKKKKRAIYDRFADPPFVIEPKPCCCCCYRGCYGHCCRPCCNWC